MAICVFGSRCRPVRPSWSLTIRALRICVSHVAACGRIGTRRCTTSTRRPPVNPPIGLKRNAPERWLQVASGNSYQWHDGRLHAFALQAVAPGSAYAGPWRIPVRVNGRLIRGVGLALVPGWPIDRVALAGRDSCAVRLGCVAAAGSADRRDGGAGRRGALRCSGSCLAAIGRDLHGRPGYRALASVELAFITAFSVWAAWRVASRSRGLVHVLPHRGRSRLGGALAASRRCSTATCCWRSRRSSVGSPRSSVWAERSHSSCRPSACCEKSRRKRRASQLMMRLLRLWPESRSWGSIRAARVGYVDAQMFRGSLRLPRLAARAGLVPVAAFAVHQLRYLPDVRQWRGGGADRHRSLVPALGGALDHAARRGLGRGVSVVARSSGRRKALGIRKGRFLPRAVARLCLLPARDLLHPGVPGGPVRDRAPHRNRGDLRFRWPVVDPQRDRCRPRARDDPARSQLDARPGQPSGTVRRSGCRLAGYRASRARAKSRGFRPVRWFAGGAIAARLLLVTSCAWPQ